MYKPTCPPARLVLTVSPSPPSQYASTIILLVRSLPALKAVSNNNGLRLAMSGAGVTIEALAHVS
jgi:hypothetical protein